MSDNLGEQLEPAIIVIFGITGDLAQRYLLPSLYHLFNDHLLHESTQILGVTRSDTTKEQLFEKVDLLVNETDKTGNPESIEAMRSKTTMFQMDVDKSEDYDRLLQKLNEIEATQGVCMNRLYYLSIPPQAYRPIVKLLGEHGLNKSCEHGNAATRLLVEKPFGYDLPSAEELISETSNNFSEEQIFRIDHYMAKETVQNILTFRFQNPIFEALWDREHVTSINISARQEIGIEGRAKFYEPLGALRDFIQSHLLQIMGIILMDKPEVLDSEHIHAAKLAALQTVEPIPADQVTDRVIRGQYRGYREEVDNDNSVTETYAQITVYSNSVRWQGVPITIMTGKALNDRRTEVKVSFHGSEENGEGNDLRFRIQPNEGIELDLITKKPGYKSEVRTTSMNFSYRNDFANPEHPNAYERVLVDAVRGDHTLFATSQEVLATWHIVQPILDDWAKGADDLLFYDQGTEGPKT